jgi:hypothetical protein
MYRLVSFLVVMLWLVGCNTTVEKTSVPVATQTPATETPPIPTPQPTLEVSLRLTLETQFDDLQAAQEAIAEVWQGLQRNQSVSCAQELPRLESPATYAGENPISVQLFSAALFLDTAYDLWQTECQNPRQQPPPDVIDQGVRAALSAGDALTSARQMLTTP